MECGSNGRESDTLARCGGALATVARSGRTYHHGAVQGAVVDALELLLDRLQVDLRAADYDPDEGGVVGAGAVHGLVQPVGEKGRRRLDALDCKVENGYIGGASLRLVQY